MIKEFRINKRSLKVAALTLFACLLVFPLAAPAAGKHVRIIGGFGFGGFYPYGGFWPEAYWGPYYPYYGYYDGYYAGTNMGKVKLEDPDKMDLVYVEGAYAGTAGDLKTMHLRSGTYNLEIKRGDKDVLSERLYVLSGKTVKVIVPR